MGAGKKIERHRAVEVTALNSGLCYLSYSPLQLTDIIKIEIRAVGLSENNLDSWNRSITRSGFSRWTEVSQYELDPDNGELTVEFGRFSGTPFCQAAPAQVRVEYMAGVDFSENPLSSRAIALKSALAGILNISIERPAGLKSYTVVDYYRVDYDTAQAFNQYLEVFKQL